MAGLLLPAALLVAAPAPAPALHVATLRGSPLTFAVAQLQDGDLVFRRGHDLMAATVLGASDAARFSHVGLFLRLQGRPMIVHSAPAEAENDSGVIAEPIARFLEPGRAADQGAYRVAALDEQGRQRLRSVALAALGRPFDYDLRYSTNNRLYCTELVLKALAAAGVELRPRLPTVRLVLMTEPAIAPDALRLARGVVPVGNHNRETLP